MKKIISIFIALMAMVSTSHASWVIFVNTNSLGQPDTNTFLLQSISSPIQANGQWFETGIAIRARPNASGIFATNLGFGNWIASNAFLANPNNLGGIGSTRGIIIAVPPGSGTNYAAALVISGANTYNYRLGTLTGTNGITATLADSNNWVIGLAGTNGVNSLAQGTNVSVQNAGGGALTVNADVSHGEVSNSVFVASNSLSGRLTALTNGFNLQIVTSNPASFYLNSNPSNYVTSSIINGLTSTNYVKSATNDLDTTLRALVILATNSVLNQATAFTNGLPTTATLNSASNSLKSQIINATNDLNTTLRALITTTSNGAVATAATFTNGLVNTAGLNTASNALISTIVSASNSVFVQARTMTNDLNGNIRTVITNHVNYASNALVGSYTTAINAASNSLQGQISSGGGGGVSTNYIQGATNTAVVGALTITTNNINTVSNFLRAFTVNATNDLNTTVGTLVTAATNAVRSGTLATTTNFVSNTSNSLFTSLVAGDQSASNSLFTSLVAATNTLLNGGVSNLVNTTSNGLMGRISASTSAQWTASLALSNSLAGNITTLNTQTNYLAKTNDSRAMYWTNNANQLGIFTASGFTNTGSSRLVGDVVALGNISVTGGVVATQFSGAHEGNGAGLSGLDASQLAVGTVPLSVLSGIRSNNIDANTWLLATNNVNALSVVSAVSNAFVAWTNGQMFGNPEFRTESGATATTNHYFWQNNGTNIVFNWFKNVGAVNTTQSPPMITFGQDSNIYVGSFLVGSAATLTNVNPGNLSAGLITNQDIYFGLDAGTLQSTNYVEVRGAGSTGANPGLYYWDGVLQYTNANTGYMVSNNGSVWVVKNASASALYTFPTIPSTNGTISGGIAPAPAISYGASYRMDGDAFDGWANFKSSATFSSNTYLLGPSFASNLYVQTLSVTNLTAQSVISPTGSVASFNAGVIDASINNGIIFVRTNDVNGLNYALTNLAVATNKTMVGGGHIILQHGTHYLTTALLYSNEWPANITIESEGIPGANVVYVGPSTNVNPLRFMGNHAHDGTLLSVRLLGVGFYSAYDTTNWVMQIQEAGWVNIDQCRFAYWVVATNNNNRGLGMPEDFPVPSRATNLGGLYLASGNIGAGVTMSHCYFQFLQNGVYDACDHTYFNDNYFSLVGSASTGWPTNSPFRLGSAIIKTNGSGSISDNIYVKTHFTFDYICLWDHDNSSEQKLMGETRVEGGTYRFISAVPNALGSFQWRNSINNDPDGIAGIQGTTWAITNTPPPYMKITGVDYGYGKTNLVMLPSRLAGFYVTPQGNSYTTGTNNSRAWYQPYQLDQWMFIVTGGETEVNGTYVFRNADWYDPGTYPLLRFFLFTNTVSSRTNLLAYDPSGAAVSVAPWSIITQTNHVLDENILYFDSALSDAIPPATTWDQAAGSSPNITVIPVYGQFKVYPNGSLEGLTGTIRSNLFVSGAAYMSNVIVLPTNPPSVLSVLSSMPGGTGIQWNSNADLYWVSKSPFGSTVTTNKMVSH